MTLKNMRWRHEAGTEEGDSWVKRHEDNEAVSASYP